nr:hypothetical protein [Tanacetum cinerariifolium]
MTYAMMAENSTHSILFKKQAGHLTFTLTQLFHYFVSYFVLPSSLKHAEVVLHCLITVKLSIDLYEPKDSSKTDKAAQNGRTPKSLTLKIYHGGWFTPSHCRSYIGGQSEKRLALSHQKLSKEQPASFVARPIIVESVVDPFDGLDEILGDYANTEKPITRDESTWKQMVEADTQSEEKESGTEGNDTSGSDSEDLDYDPNHDDDDEHIVEELHVNVINFNFTTDPKHDTSIGIVDVQEDDLNVIDYDLFGSDLDDEIDPERRIQLMELRRISKQKKQRVYVCLGALKQGFRACGREILGLDGCSMSGPWPGQILTAVWIDANNEIYPVAYAIVEAESKASWDALEGVYKKILWNAAKATSEVTRPYKDQYVVNMDRRVCSCRKWELTGIPCKHAVAAIYNMSENSVRVGIPEQWVYAAYRIETWAHVYSFKPPKKRKKPNDEIASQRSSSGKLSRNGKSVSCGKCGNVGHNRKGCRVQGGGSSQVGARKVYGQAVGSRKVSGQATSARNVSGQAAGARKASSQPSTTQSTTNQGPKQGFYKAWDLAGNDMWELKRNTERAEIWWSFFVVNDNDLRQQKQLDDEEKKYDRTNGQCAWPFHQPIYGPQGAPLVAPNNDVGMDGMVIYLASLLAGTATNPFGNGYYQGDAGAPLEAASACPGVYGKGAYPGYPGDLLVESTTGASYNAHGANGRKYLVPAMYDPSTSTCSTLLNESTYQVALDALALTTCYPAFLITVVPVIYMHQFWATVTKHKSSYQFKIDNKKFSMNVEVFRDILNICPRIQGQEFDELATKEEALCFIRELGHSREINLLGTMRFLSKHADTQVYGAILPKAMTSQALLDSVAYKTYFAIASGVEPRKLRKSLKKSDSAISYEESPSKKKSTKAKKVATTKPKPTKKKEPLKKATKQSKKDVHISQASGSGDGINFESRVPDEQYLKTTGADEETSTIPGVPDVSKYDCENKCDNDDDDDDDNDVNDDDNQEGDDTNDDDEETDSDRTELDRIKIHFLNQSSTEYYEEEEEEKIDDEEMMDEEKDDESGFKQEEEDAHVTLTPIHDTQKTVGPMQSFSVSSDFTSKLLNLENVSPYVNEIASLMDTVTIPPPPPFFNPLSQHATPNPTPTNFEATTVIPALPDFLFIFRSRDKRRKSSKEAESSRDSRSKENKSSSIFKDASHSQQKPSGKSAHAKEQQVDSRPPQTWISQVAPAKEPLTSFDELMDTLFDFFAFVLNRLNIKDLTQEILVGPAFELLKGTCKSLTELEYHLEECSKATTERLDWYNPEAKSYSFNLSKPLLLIRDHRGRQVFPWDFFINNDLEYLKGEDLSRRKRIIAVTRLKIMKKYDYSHLKEIEVRQEDQKLYKFREALDALAHTTCYPAFLITAEGQEFDEPATKEEALCFIRELGHSREIKYMMLLLIIYANHGEPLHQSSTSVSVERYRVLDLAYHIDNMDSKKQDKMFYLRFTKIIIHHFLDNDKSISIRNIMFMHTARDDSLLGTMRFLSKHADTQVCGAILPKAMTSQALLDSVAYKTYFAIASGAEPQKLRKSLKKSDSAISSEESPSKKKSTKAKKVAATKPKPTKKKEPVKADRGKGDGFNFESRVPDEQYLKTTGADEGTSTIPGVLDVSKYDSENKCDNDDDDDDDYDNDVNDDDNQEGDDTNDDDEETDSDRTELDIIKIHVLNQSSTEYYEKEEEKIDDEEMMDEEMMDEEKDDESGFKQEEEDAHVTLTPIHDTQKTAGPMQSFSVSSDFTSKLLNLENVSPYVNEIASLMDTVTIPPPPPFFNPLSQQATPTPTPINFEATTVIPTLLDFLFVFSREEVQAEKMDYIELIDTSMRANLKEEVNTQLPRILPQAISDFATLVIEKNVTESLEAVVLARSRDKRRKSSKKAESSRDSRSKENKSSSIFKGASHSQQKPSGKSAHAKEKRIIAVTRLTIMKKYDYSHLKEIEVRQEDQKLYKFREDPKGMIYKDQNDRNILMCADELHKFSDGTLNDVRTALNDIAKGIRMEYMSKRKWSGLDKRRAPVMV